MAMFDPPHPGLLILDILQNGDLTIARSVSALARHIGVTRAALSRVANGKAGVSPEMALKLQDALGVKAEMWLRLQAARDLWLAGQKKRMSIASVAVLDKAA